MPFENVSATLTSRRYIDNQELLNKNDGKIRELQDTVRMLTSQMEHMGADSVCVTVSSRSFPSH
jgi:hypothetical protein